MSKKIFVLLVILIMLFTFVSCAQNNQDENDTLIYYDSLNNQIDITNVDRVACLSSSIVDAYVSVGGNVCCVTQDVYEEGRDIVLPDDVFNAGSLKTPSAEIVIRSNPDLVILSAALSTHIELGTVLKSAGIQCAFFETETFDEYLYMLNIMAKITKREDLYSLIGVNVKNDIDQIIAQCKDFESQDILLIRAFSTSAKAKDSNNMVGAMLKDLGCNNIADSDSGLLEDLSLEVIVKADPKFIFLTTMGDNEKALEAFAKNLQSNPAWEGLTAVKENRFIILQDKSLYHYKPNSRWGESYEQLAQILYNI